MKTKKILCIFLLLITFSITSYAHSGRTDSKGGHYNRSTGDYHYHHGYPEHQHPNGICPYEEAAKQKKIEAEKKEKKREKKKPYLIALSIFSISAFLLPTFLPILFELFSFIKKKVKPK